MAYSFDVMGMVYNYPHLHWTFDSALLGSGKQVVPIIMYPNVSERPLLLRHLPHDRRDRAAARPHLAARPPSARGRARRGRRGVVLGMGGDPPHHGAVDRRPVPLRGHGVGAPLGRALLRLLLHREL